MANNISSEDIVRANPAASAINKQNQFKPVSKVNEDFEEILGNTLFPSTKDEDSWIKEINAQLELLLNNTPTVTNNNPQAEYIVGPDNAIWPNVRGITL